MSLLVGVDIGGTKCAVVLGRESGESVEIIDKARFPTPPTYTETLDQLVAALADLLTKYPDDTLDGIGISCGGPLNSKTGLILSAPNLPGGWDRVDVIAPFTSRFGVPAALQNDANACALAEWRWGAGRGTQNMIFLTFGTGMGAGLILDGRLYSGTNDLGGEVGHMRLAEDGPIDFGKTGSFEGFCSGGGIARLGRTMAEATLAQSGQGPAFAPTPADIDTITAEKVARAANNGDPLALAVFNIVAEHLGRGLALLIDVLNPERIVIGSIFLRQRDLLEPAMNRVLAQEAIPLSLAMCEIVSAGLGERVGDYAALAIALEARKWISR
jgi:glucokinase